MSEQKNSKQVKQMHKMEEPGKVIVDYFFENYGEAGAARRMQYLMEALKEAKMSPKFQGLFRKDPKEATNQLLFLHGLRDDCTIENQRVFQALQNYLFA